MADENMIHVFHCQCKNLRNGHLSFILARNLSSRKVKD